MSEKIVNSVIETTLSEIKGMMDANTVVGDAITAGDTVIIPISKLTMGFASGGTDFSSKNNPSGQLYGGGSGAGLSVSPVAFIIISNGTVHVSQITEASDAAGKAMNLVPELADKVLNLFVKKDKESAADKKKDAE